MWDEALRRGLNAPYGGTPVWCLGQVVGYRQRARSGTKAWVRWLADGSTTATWLEGAWPRVGTHVLAYGAYGHGAHHQEQVFYVDRGSLSVVPAKAAEAWRRQQRRQAQRGKRSRRRAGRTPA